MKKFSPADFSILLVDDNPKNLQLLASLLSRQKYNFEFTTDGTKAIDWIKKKTFDLILLDVMMPQIDGYEVCKRIRKQKKYDDMPIVFLTAKLDKESIVQGFEAGAQDYVSKPFNAKELFARIKTQLDLKASKERLKSMNTWLEEKVRERTIELKESNTQLSEANNELMVLDKAKTEFLHMISHEIRTPLNGIIPAFGILKKRLANKEDEDLLYILDTSISRLARFSTLALLITELKTKKYRFNNEPVKLKEIGEISLNKLKTGIKEKNITIDLSGMDGEFYIEADCKLIIECFTFIIDNAVKYSETDGIVKLIQSRKKNSIVFEVSDEGKGISEKALKHLFEPFSPGEDHVSQNEGLELAIAKLIMDAHDGSIKAHNNKTKGATVSLSFPAFDKTQMASKLQGSASHN